MSIKVTPEFLTKSISFRAGLIVLVILGGMLYLTFKAQTGMPFAKTTQVQALISDVHSLKANDGVRKNSKIIGRVSDIELRDGAALVTMELDGDVDVHKDARAEVWDLSALATKFVELDTGTSKTGDLGSEPIPVAQTESSADLHELLNTLDPKTRKAATQTLREIGGGAAGHSKDLEDFVAQAPDLLKDLESVSGALAAPETDLSRVLNDVDRLSGRLRTRQGELGRLVTQTDKTLDSVSVDNAVPLRESLRRLPGTLTQTDKAMTSLHDPLADTAVAMRKLAPGARALGRSEKDLRGFLREAVPVAGKVPGVADQAIPAVESLTETVADARPLAPRVRQAVSDLVTPLQALAPYYGDMAQLFHRGASFVSQGPSPGVRYARLGLTPGLNTVTGGLLRSGNVPQNEYPQPGMAQHDRAEGLLPPGVPAGVN